MDSRQVHHFRAIVMQGKRDFRIDQSNAFELCQNIIQFRLVGLQELATGRDIEEKILHIEITALRTGNRFLTLYFRAGNTQGSSQLLAFQTGTQLHLSYGRNRSQSLSTESHCLKGKQIGRFANLGGGMAFKSQTGIRFRHTLAIIDDLNGSLSGIHYLHINMLRSRINGIFHQFLDDGSRALNHLTCRNLIGNRIGKQTNYITHRPLLEC